MLSQSWDPSSYRVPPLHIGCVDETTPRRRCGPRLVETHGNNRPRTVRISTTSGSQKAAIVPWWPAAHVTITHGRALSPATSPLSHIARYSSPLGVPGTTTSGIRSSSPPGEPGTRGTVGVRHVINSRQNTVTGVEGEIIGVAKDLMLQYTVYVNPLPNLVAFMSEVHSVWSRAQDEIADAGNIDPSLKSIHIVSPRSLRQTCLPNYERSVKHTLACGRRWCII